RTRTKAQTARRAGPTGARRRRLSEGACSESRGSERDGCGRDGCGADGGAQGGEPRRGERRAAVTSGEESRGATAVGEGRGMREVSAPTSAPLRRFRSRLPVDASAAAPPCWPATLTAAPAACARNARRAAAPVAVRVEKLARRPDPKGDAPTASGEALAGALLGGLRVGGHGGTVDAVELRPDRQGREPLGGQPAEGGAHDGRRLQLLQSGPPRGGLDGKIQVDAVRPLDGPLQDRKSVG